MDITLIFEDIDISNKEKEVLKRRILSLIALSLEKEKESMGLFILDFFNEYPLIESKSDLRYFLDELEEKIELDLSELEKKL